MYEPSANSVSASNLLRLSHYTGRHDWLLRSEQLLAAFSDRLQRVPVALPEMVQALMAHHYTLREIVICGQREAPDTLSLLSAVHSLFLPHKITEERREKERRRGEEERRDEERGERRGVERRRTGDEKGEERGDERRGEDRKRRGEERRGEEKREQQDRGEERRGMKQRNEKAEKKGRRGNERIRGWERKQGKKRSSISGPLEHLLKQP
ncbi:hypothetical protein F7725_013886 [Dissostichus mawsoni]|uniref:Uncharacterized protein n=1 Tax=Dissostichus mawsoni TaxID=36200 RepID=A0A7J5YYM2_DISMA|nr:hypothetical protein F7725_013886 [Dissostichus mawsoni]